MGRVVDNCSAHLLPMRFRMPILKLAKTKS